MYNNL